MAVQQTPPQDDEHITRQVVYEHTTSSRQNIGVIIAIIVLALALVVFIAMQVRQKPPRRRGAVDPRPSIERVVRYERQPQRHGDHSGVTESFERSGASLLDGSRSL